MEEAGATIGPATEILTLTEPGPITIIEHYFLARLLHVDPNRGPQPPPRTRARTQAEVG